MQAQSQTTVIIFAKAPIEGYAKTRLTPKLGPKGAIRAHKRLVRIGLRHALGARYTKVQIHCSEQHPFFLNITRQQPVTLHLQAEGDLGARMLAAIREASLSNKKDGAVLLMGSDCPSITPTLIETCAAALTTHDLVFLPAEDGGYGLIGVKDPHTSALESVLSDIPWGTHSVMQTTRLRLQAASVSWSEPAVIWDVDHPEDLARLNELV